MADRHRLPAPLKAGGKDRGGVKQCLVDLCSSTYVSSNLQFKCVGGAKIMPSFVSMQRGFQGDRAILLGFDNYWPIIPPLGDEIPIDAMIRSKLRPKSLPSDLFEYSALQDQVHSPSRALSRWPDARGK